MAEVQLPYRAEYSKSSRAACKTCKEKIEKDILRLAAMVQSPMFDGKVPNWYHYQCFFIKQRPASVSDIENFESLRYDDQKKIKEKIESAGAATPSGSKKGKSKSKAAGGASAGVKEFSVEVAQQGRAGCRGCEQKILKGEVRISKMDYTSDSARQYGPMPRWHHIQCFLGLRDELQWWGDAKELPGFYALPADIQDQVADQIKKVKRKAEDVVDAPPLKKPKKEDEQKLKKQNDAMFKFRDQLQKQLSKRQLAELLEYNFSSFEGSGIGETIMHDLLADFMTFGMPEPCAVCKGGMLVFRSGAGYRCTGHLTEYTRCPNIQKAPKRRPFRVPAELAVDFPFLLKYKQPALGERLFEERAPTVTKQASNSSQSDGPKTASLRPLAGMSFVLHGRCSGLEGAVKALGGIVAKTASKTTAAVITSAEDVDKRDKVLKKAEELGVQCVAEDFLEEVKAGGGGALLLIKKKAISDWGEDPEKRVRESKLYSTVHKSGKSAKSSSSKESKYTKSVPDKMKLQLKDGGAVDPDSGLSDSAHVLTYGGKLFNCVMGMVDIVKGTNSYYKLQLLESDKKTSWWVFRSWGRIGTTIGGNKLESMEDKQDAIQHFQAIYEDKTRNRFGAETFKKVSGAWTLLDVDYDQEDTKEQKLTVSASSSALPISVQELVALIFDVDTMKSQMMEFEIDLKKLPLGKLSRRQLMAAFSVLTEAQELLNQDCKTNGLMILDCSNRFYTLIPHDFGINTIPILDNLELIKSKIEMVESLSEIEVAYNLLKSEGDGNAEGGSPIDKHYKKLDTKIEVVAADSEEYKVLQQYVTNTHAETHSHYKLKIVNAFRVERKGEAKRFKPFKKLPNHKLLWHGSRLTNFAGILSQGLRIAPPEAPVTGYMFGKGIYFADMVSKSANYCSTSSSNSTGLMLLCDVALGNMYERMGAEYVTKLSGGHHSTKGCGRTHPDPAGSTHLGGVEVPLGKSITDASLRSTLLYNEYIVYDIAQVEVKYLLRMDFLYNV